MSPHEAADDERTTAAASSFPLIDVDCNLLHPDLLSLAKDPDNNANNANDPFAILSHESTRNSNIVAMLSPSSTIPESETFIKLLTTSSHSPTASSNIQIKTTAGIHPYHVTTSSPDDDENDDLTRLRNLFITTPSTILSCIGECGLDYSSGFPPPELQRPWFDAQLDLAFTLQKPIFLHERLAFRDTLQAIDDAANRHAAFPIPNIIVHCFTGTQSECNEYVSRGYYFSVSGYILKNGEGPEEVRTCLIRDLIPLEKLMIETDAPYMGFEDCRLEYLNCEPVDRFEGLNSKKRKRLYKAIYPNVPSSLRLVLKGVLECVNEGRRMRGERELSEEELGRMVCRNAVEFFGFEGDF